MTQPDSNGLLALKYKCSRVSVKREVKSLSATANMEKISLTVSLLVFAFVHFGPVSTLSPGVCPREEPGLVGICVFIPGESCLTDDGCSSGLKCCRSECGKKCVKPVKPGKCPRPSGPGICIQACNHDYDCETDQKCCSNGCGNKKKKKRKIKCLNPRCPHVYQT
uniref:WAP domain-containing protein n=1 Tax=Salarias fasciatus TaxID=181472 RepID=A0A672FBZ0_SALFA